MCYYHFHFFFWGSIKFPQRNIKKPIRKKNWCFPTVTGTVYLTHFFQISKRGIKKIRQIWKSFVTDSRKTGKCWNQNFFTGRWLILTLWLVTSHSFLPKIDQIVQKIIVFFPKEIESWFWHIRLKFYCTTTYFFYFDRLQEKTGSHSCTKSANFESVSFP